MEGKNTFLNPLKRSALYDTLPSRITEVDETCSSITYIHKGIPSVNGAISPRNMGSLSSFGNNTNRQSFKEIGTGFGNSGSSHLRKKSLS